MGQRQSDGFRIESSEELLAERATVILKLSERVKSLEVLSGFAVVELFWYKVVLQTP